MEARLNIITLGVRDLDKAIRFYRDGLGWPMSRISAGDFAIFKLSTGTALALYPRKLLALDANVMDPGGFGGITLAHNVATREEVDLVLSQAIKSGGSILKPAQAPEWVAIQDILRIQMGIPGRLPGILISNLSRVAWFCPIRERIAAPVLLPDDQNGRASSGAENLIGGRLICFEEISTINGKDRLIARLSSAGQAHGSSMQFRLQVLLLSLKEEPLSWQQLQDVR